MAAISGAIFSTASVVVLCVVGVGAVVEGLRHVVTPVNQDRVIESAAMVSLSQTAESLRRDMAGLVRPQMDRTEKLARDPDVIAALESHDAARLMAACNKAITAATEIDAVALFDRDGKIVGIKSVYASGAPIDGARVARIMGMTFDDRDIIQGCVRNGAASNILEFQTTCDITPALFDSSGLSVAYSVPAIDPATGVKVGVVSTRVRFERLTDLIRTRALAGKAGSAEFVTDKGGYFSESINTGKSKPPVPVATLAGIVKPMASGKVDAVFCKNGADYLCLVRLKDFSTLAGGGIQAMLIVKGDWLATEARQAKALAAAGWIGGGLAALLGARVVGGIRALRTSEQWNRLLIDSAVAAVVVTDDGGRIEEWNPRAENMFGRPAADVIGKDLVGLVGPPAEDRNRLVAVFNPEGPTTGRHTDLELVKSDGGRITARVTASAMRIGNRTRHCVFLYDITEYKLAQSQLAQAQKLESIGQLAAGIAHEINTPAQYVGDNVRFLKEQFGGLISVIDTYGRLIGGSEPMTWAERRGVLERTLKEVDFDFVRAEIPQAIDQSLEGIARVSAIVGAMKDFSHPGSDHKEAADLNRSIASTIEVCRNRWKFVADLSTDFDPALPAVHCLVAEFNQVILNLIVNAADAIGEKLGTDTTERGHIAVSTRLKRTTAGDVAEVRIADDGPGIPEAVRRRIFEPFFTTKPVGKGTGQGLTISRGVIVDKHGGELTFEAHDGPGTTFVIRLPINRRNRDVETSGDIAEAA